MKNAHTICSLQVVRRLPTKGAGLYTPRTINRPKPPLD